MSYVVLGDMDCLFSGCIFEKEVKKIWVLILILLFISRVIWDEFFLVLVVFIFILGMMFVFLEYIKIFRREFCIWDLFI